MNLPETSELVTFSDSCKNLFAAFVKFAADNSNVEKNKTNPHFKSRYADLASAINGSRDHLAKHELAVMQHPFTRGEYVGVITILCHSSGEFLRSELLLKPIKNDPQAAGSAITYARRYAFMAILNMSAEDDDANMASNAPKEATIPYLHSLPDKKVEQPRAIGFDPKNSMHLNHINTELEKRGVMHPNVRDIIIKKMIGRASNDLDLVIDQMTGFDVTHQDEVL